MANEGPAGWQKLIDGLLAALDDVPGWSPDLVEQIKEKFGGLRFYYREPEGGFATLDRVKIIKLVNRAEALAWKTCSTCGTTEGVAQRNNHGWLRTSCQACWDKRFAT